MKHILLCLILFSGISQAATQYVYNVTKNEIVIDSASDTIRPIASVTKLMTAVVMIESGLSLEEKILYKGSRFLHRKMRTREELLFLTLVKSDNIAAESLANSLPNGRDDFILRMNKKAQTLGMVNTSYEDASGLGFKNQSTAKDLTTLLQYAHKYEKIRNIASTISFKIDDSVKRKKRVVTVNNTNFRLLKDYNIEISKTGFTNPAGKCLAMFLTKNNQKYIIIILGEKNMNSVEMLSRRIIKGL